MQRLWRLTGTIICFILAGGDWEGLAEEALDDKRHLNAGAIRDEAGRNVERRARQRVEPLLDAQPRLPNPGQPDLPHPDEPLESTEPTKVYHRAITSLYAGTALEAGKLSGKVGVSSLPNCS
jgi:hypothetical protein